MPLSEQPVLSRPGSLGGFLDPPRPPNDKTIYAGFGIGLTLVKYQQIMEDEGYTWTSSLGDRVNALIQLIHNNLGIGITKEHLIQAYEAAGTGYKGSHDFLIAFNRCEMEYFRAEIRSLQAEHPEWHLPQVLDELKGGETTKTSFKHNQELAKRRLESRRLFATDVGPNTFCHRFRTLSPQNNQDNAQLTTYFYGGFMYQATIPNQESFPNHGVMSSTIESQNHATLHETALQQDPISPSYALNHSPEFRESSMHSTASQTGTDPTRQSFASASTAYEHNSMIFLDDNVSEYIDDHFNFSDRIKILDSKQQSYHPGQADVTARHRGMSVDHHSYNSLPQPDNEQNVIQVDTVGTSHCSVKRPRSSSSEGMASEIERLKHKINRLKASAGVDKSEIQRLNQSNRCLEDRAALDKSEIERMLRINLEECHKKTMMDLGPRFQSLQIDHSSLSAGQDNIWLGEPPFPKEQSDSPKSGPTVSDSQDPKRHRNIFKTLRQKTSKKNLRAAKSVPDYNSIRDHIAITTTPLPALPAHQHAVLGNGHFGGGMNDASRPRYSSTSTQAVKDFPMHDRME